MQRLTYATLSELVGTGDNKLSQGTWSKIGIKNIKTLQIDKVGDSGEGTILRIVIRLKLPDTDNAVFSNV
jgi:hypothetical protein